MRTAGATMRDPTMPLMTGADLLAGLKRDQPLARVPVIVAQPGLLSALRP